jgi:hypothetical protein
MAHKTKESRKKKPSSCLHPKLSNKRWSTLPHKAQNTKCQYQNWTPKATTPEFYQADKYFVIAVSGVLGFFLFLFLFCVINLTSLFFLPPFSCASIYCSPSQLLFLPLLIHSLPLSSPPTAILPQPITTLPLLHTHHPLTSLLHQLPHTLPLKSLIQTSSTTTVEIHPNTHKGHETQQPHDSSPTHHPFTDSLLVPLRPIT